MNDRTFGIITFLAGLLLLVVSVLLNVRQAPAIECEEDEIVTTVNGRDHDTCVNAEEFVEDYLTGGGR